jgi:hypothetical protein
VICGEALGSHGAVGRSFQWWLAGSDPQAAILGGMQDDGDATSAQPRTQSPCATLRPAALQPSVPVAVLELAHRTFDRALEVTPIGGVTQLSCETEA